MDWIIIILKTIERLNKFYVYITSGYIIPTIFAVVLILVLFFLIYIRAGLPRYRYDFLTKLGWSNLLLMVILTLTVTYFILGLLF